MLSRLKPSNRCDGMVRSREIRYFQEQVTNTSIRVLGLARVWKKQGSRSTYGIAIGIRSALGWQWPEPLSKKSRSWLDRRRSQCLPGTAISHLIIGCPSLTGFPLHLAPPQHKTLTAIRTATNTKNGHSWRVVINCLNSLFSMVPGGGLEPPWPCGLRILSPLRLPISPSGPRCAGAPRRRLPGLRLSYQSGQYRK